MTTQIDPETAALNLLLRGKPEEAHAALRVVVERDPNRHWDLARIMNLIDLGRQGATEALGWAENGLRRRPTNRRIEQYQLHRPADADISRVVTA